METTEIKFERENLEGIIPIGTYLADAAGRMGVELWRESFGEAEYAVVKITAGGDLLSAPTETETELLSAEKRFAGERLAEQAKIERAGELTIMTTQKPKANKPDYETKKEEYRKEFEELPLEKKIASLVELEAIAFSETVSFVINSPYQLAGKLIDVLAQFGFQKDAEAKKQARPAEHQTETAAKTNGKKHRKTAKTAKDAAESGDETTHGI